MATRLLAAWQSAWATRDDRGASAVEYGLMVALIAVVIIAAVTALGTKLTSMFCDVTSRMGN